MVAMQWNRQFQPIVVIATLRMMPCGRPRLPRVTHRHTGYCNTPWVWFGHIVWSPEGWLMLVVSWQENPVLVLFMEALGVVSSCTCETSHCIGYKMTCVCCGSSAWSVSWPQSPSLQGGGISSPWIGPQWQWDNKIAIWIHLAVFCHFYWLYIVHFFFHVFPADACRFVQNQQQFDDLRPKELRGVRVGDLMDFYQQLLEGQATWLPQLFLDTKWNVDMIWVWINTY